MASFRTRPYFVLISLPAALAGCGSSSGTAPVFPSPEGRARVVSTVPGSSWQAISQLSTSIAVGSNGTAWSIGKTDQVGCCDHGVYFYDGSSWSTAIGAPFGASKISVSPDGTPWAINSQHQIFKWNGSTWGSAYPDLATDLAARSAGHANSIGVDSAGCCDHHIFYWNGSSWVGPIGGTGAGGVSISVTPDTGVVYIVNSSHGVAYWAGSGWASNGVTATEYTAGPNGTAWKLGTTAIGCCDYPLSYFDGTAWTDVPTPNDAGAAQVSVGPDGTTWIRVSDGTLYERV